MPGPTPYLFKLSHLNRTGASCKLNNRIANDLYTYLQEGFPIPLACKLVDITPATFKQWLSRGEGEGSKQPFRTFAVWMRKALAKADLDMMKQIKKAGARDWRAAAWRLTRKHPELHDSAIIAQYEKPPAVAVSLAQYQQLSSEELLKRVLEAADPSLLELPQVKALLPAPAVEAEFKETTQESEQNGVDKEEPQDQEA